MIPHFTNHRLLQFVVDDAWILDTHKPTESDEHGIPNNVLQISDIQPLQPNPAQHIMSNITPGSTTAALAGQVPKEASHRDVPGAFIETPSTEPDAFSVNPIPASGGFGNPIKLAPGEKVPENTASVDSAVKTDKASYEKADAGPAAALAGLAKDDKPKSSIIPESSLPIGGSNTIQSAGATSTTAALAGAVPKEPRGVPEVVTESQHAAHVDPEASGNAEAVTEKKEVEAELKKKVHQEPATSESGLGKETAAGVPAVVSESLREAHQSPEAAANSEAVAEKSAVEDELEKKVAVSESAGEPAPTTTAATSAVAPGGGMPTDSGDVSPLSKPNTTAQAAPAAATTESKTEAGPATPQKENVKPSAEATPENSKATKSEERKSKRRSIFAKLKKIF